ncbi:hypothetical protein BKA93DRAFT_748590 [Sparassis latifolia]
MYANGGTNVSAICHSSDVSSISLWVWYRAARDNENESKTPDSGIYYAIEEPILGRRVGSRTPDNPSEGVTVDDDHLLRIMWIHGHPSPAEFLTDSMNRDQFPSADVDAPTLASTQAELIRNSEAVEDSRELVNAAAFIERCLQKLLCFKLRPSYPTTGPPHTSMRSREELEVWRECTSPTQRSGDIDLEAERSSKIRTKLTFMNACERTCTV